MSATDRNVPSKLSHRSSTKQTPPELSQASSRNRRSQKDYLAADRPTQGSSLSPPSKRASKAASNQSSHKAPGGRPSQAQSASKSTHSKSLAHELSIAGYERPTEEEITSTASRFSQIGPKEGVQRTFKSGLGSASKYDAATGRVSGIASELANSKRTGAGERSGLESKRASRLNDLAASKLTATGKFNEDLITSTAGRYSQVGPKEGVQRTFKPSLSNKAKLELSSSQLGKSRASLAKTAPRSTLNNTQRRTTEFTSSLKKTDLESTIPRRKTAYQAPVSRSSIQETSKKVEKFSLGAGPGYKSEVITETKRRFTTAPDGFSPPKKLKTIEEKSSILSERVSEPKHSTSGAFKSKHGRSFSNVEESKILSQRSTRGRSKDDDLPAGGSRNYRSSLNYSHVRKSTIQPEAANNDRRATLRSEISHKTGAGSRYSTLNDNKSRFNTIKEEREDYSSRVSGGAGTGAGYSKRNSYVSKALPSARLSKIENNLNLGASRLSKTDKNLISSIGAGRKSRLDPGNNSYISRASKTQNNLSTSLRQGGATDANLDDEDAYTYAMRLGKIPERGGAKNPYSPSNPWRADKKSEISFKKRASAVKESGYRGSTLLEKSARLNDAATPVKPIDKDRRANQSTAPRTISNRKSTIVETSHKVTMSTPAAGKGVRNSLIREEVARKEIF